MTAPSRLVSKSTIAVLSLVALACGGRTPLEADLGRAGDGSQGSSDGGPGEAAADLSGACPPGEQVCRTYCGTVQLHCYPADADCAPLPPPCGPPLGL